MSKNLTDTVSRETSLAHRVKYFSLLIAGGGLASMVGLLWATEPGLPLRTHLSFAAVVVVGFGWAAFAAWALRSRPLFVLDRVIAGSMALTASAIFTGLGAWVAHTRSTTTGLLAVLAVGAGAMTVSAGLLRAAVKRRRALKDRLAEIEAVE